MKNNFNNYINEQNTKKIQTEKSKGKKIVLCHGVFDLFHPGHLDHLIKAKSYGDILIVTITSDKFIKKGIHNPYYNEQIRLSFLKAIKIIDYSFIVDDDTASKAINLIKPDFYCKGTEYNKQLTDKKLILEKKKIKAVGGKILFIGKNTHSSSDLISKNLFKIKNKSLLNLLKKNTINIDDTFKKIKKLNILIVGDLLIDKYNFVETKGVSPKTSVLSMIKKSELTMPGGALASYRFLNNLSDNVSFFSIANIKLKKICNNFKISLKDVIFSEDAPFIIKSRFVEYSDRITNKFTVNDYKQPYITKKDEEKIIKNISKKINKADLIIVQNFGHGLITEKIVKLLSKYKNKLSINVQANSLNYGFNVIDKDFKKAFTFTLDERELKLFSKKENVNHDKEIKKLAKKLKVAQGFLTIGNKYSAVISNNKITKIPILISDPVDTVGAGDIFHCMASVMSKVSKNPFVNLLFSQVAGSLATKIVGNVTSPEIKNIKKSLIFYKNIN